MLMILQTIAAAGLAPLLFGSIGTLLYGRGQGRRSSVNTSPAAGLLFHSILPRTVSPSQSQYSNTRFREFLSLLKAGNWQTITLSAKMRELPLVNDRRIVITFDDGFRNFYRHALPDLEENGHKVTIFIVPGFEGKKAAWDVFNGEEHLTIREIREISDLGHETGSHSLTHANLPYLDDRELVRELADSRKIIEDWTGKAVTGLSFPYGSWNARVWNKARECGYTSATLYRNHGRRAPGLFPVYGVYRFDSPADIMSRIVQPRLSPVLANAVIMSHFSKGSPVWKFRKNYRIFRRPEQV